MARKGPKGIASFLPRFPVIRRKAATIPPLTKDIRSAAMATGTTHKVFLTTGTILHRGANEIGYPAPATTPPFSALLLFDCLRQRIKIAVREPLPSLKFR
ncbi:MAG: hypothetical protein IIB75_10380 [Proteobacteria bacterium]|nr:hypothetical protein [Pseudomonadota bacterium]